MRGAVIGTVDVVSESTSPWYFDPRGLILANPMPLTHPFQYRGSLDILTDKSAAQIAFQNRRALPAAPTIEVGGIDDKSEPFLSQFRALLHKTA